MLYAWTDMLRTGDDELDHQHRTLLDQLNALHAALRAGHGSDRVGELVRFLDVYTTDHFRQEEACMDRYRCPAAAANREAHVQFLARFQQFHDQLRTGTLGGSEAAIRLIESLAAWVVNHVRQVDVKLRPCVAAARACPSAGRPSGGSAVTPGGSTPPRP